ncbi:hypothetical protein SLEP1_g48494 [Rubroshorea leprosula]|uniref:Uncharacterized protein n=1 Tax=Rubroshorea leprosula TaxID=152421 RepID=A0AAV5LTT9_9ROSI|nr:hypothetical protein SLEP1_g48494 [Rubroshorea leprosula]
MDILKDDVVTIRPPKEEGGPHVITVNCPDKIGLGLDLCRVLRVFGLSIVKGDICTDVTWCYIIFWVVTKSSEKWGSSRWELLKKRLMDACPSCYSVSGISYYCSELQSPEPPDVFMLKLCCHDRIGLLHDVAGVLCKLELIIKKMEMSTTPNGRVIDLFFITDTRVQRWSVFPEETTSGFSGVESVKDFNNVGLRSCPNIWRRLWETEQGVVWLNLLKDNMVRTFTGGRPPRNEMDEQEDTHVSEPGLNDFRPMPRNLFVGGAEQDHLSEIDDERTPTGYATQPEQFQVPIGTRQRSARPCNSRRERPERSTELARTTELEERTRVLEMAMGKILARLIPDDPLIPLLNRDAQPAAVVATRNSPALSNIVVPTRPRGSGKLNIEPSSSKHSEELMRKNADLERQLRDVQKSIDELKSPRSHQQTLDLDSAPLNLSITAEPYQEGFKIPHLETYDGSGDPDEHLHTYQAIMRIQNANDAMMCKVFPTTLKSTARRWYHKLPRHYIDSYSQLAKLFSNKFASQREIKCTATVLMQVNQKEGESLRYYMQRFNKATLDIDNVPDTICLSALLHGLKRGRFLDDLLENPPRTWNEVNDMSASFILSEDFQSSKRRADDKQGKELKQPENKDDKKKQKVSEQRGKPPSFPKYDSYIPLSSSRSQILSQIQHWVKRPPPQTHDSSRADRSKYYDYHRVYGHNTEDCQSLKDELEFLARNGKLEGYIQKPFVRQPTQTHFVQEYGRPQAPGYQLSNNPNSYQAGPYSSEPNRVYRGRPFNKSGQGQKAPAQNSKDHRGVGYGGIPPPSGTINMIFGGMHSGGQSSRAHKAYARQVMTVNKNRPLKRPFEEAEWENAAITFSPADYKRADGEPDVMMPHADPFVAMVHIGNHNVNKVFIDTGSSPDIFYWSCFQKMQLNPSSLQKYEGPIYGFNNQPVPVEGVITLPIYVGSEPRFRMASVTFLVIKMESAFNAILGRATLCELKAVISQPHLCMKFPTPQEVGVLKGNQKMARACYQDTFKKVELAEAPRVSENRRSTQPGQQTMSISDIEHRPEGVEQKAEPVEPVETVLLNPDVPERTVKIGTKLTKEERAELLEFLRVNQDVFAWTTDEMPGIPAELTVHKLSTDPTKRPVVQKRRLFGPEKQAAIDKEIQKLLQAGFIRRVEYSEWVSNPVLVKKPNGKWRMCIDFTNLNDACPKDPHPLPNVEKIVERAARHERMSFLDASSGYHQKLVQIIFKLQIDRNIEVYVDDMIVTSVRVEDHIDDLNETFQNLRRAQMKLNPLKCTFTVESGKFLGYVVSKKGIEVNPEKVLAVQQMEPPKTVKDVQRLTANIEGSGAGAVLVGPDGFRSKYALSFKFQTTNNTAEYEALIYGLKLASELKVQSIQVFSDSQLVVGQVNGSCEIRDPQLGRYAFVVNRLKSIFVIFQIDKIPRADNHRADELSKLASSQDLNPQRSTIVEILDAPSYTDSTVECQLLSTDPSTPSWTTPLINYLQSGELPEDQSAAKVIKSSMPLLRCLTPYEAEYAVREVHEGVCGMHIGGKTLARKLLRHGYYWPTMVEDAQNYVKKCPTCQFNADDIHMPGEMLSSLTFPWPFTQWGVDLLGPFIKGKGGCTFLVVAVDYFTKWIEAKPLSTTTEKKIEEFLFNSILCRFGIPKWIIVDNGPQFRAATLRSFCNDYGIELSLTSVYTPQSNGQAASDNKIVLRGLKTRVIAACSNWVDKLNKVLWSCRMTPSSATGETPFSLAYGAEAVIPVEIRLPSARSDRHDDQNNGQLLRENLDLVEEVRELARIRNMVHQSRVAKFYNNRVRARQFQVGNLVLRKAGLTNTYSHMGKLAPNWEGPYMVINIKRPGCYQLADLQGRPLSFIWNIHNLRKFYS